MQVTLGGQAVQVGGEFLQKGDAAPEFTLTSPELADVSLASVGAGKKILNIFPSVDTGTCAQSVRRFNEEAAKLHGATVLCISEDLPFAQARFCGAEGIEGVKMLSAFRSPDFRKQYGVAIENGPLRGLCARAVVVLDENHRVLYSQLVPEIKDEPDYAAALAAL